MKRLYENIEDINIKGDVSQLSEVVTAMDISLQNIAYSTEQLTEILIKYSVRNKGIQYETVVNTSMNLRNVLYDSSMELNEMQNQIVAYQNKIYRYEDRTESAMNPNPYLVEKRQINIETSAVQFNRSDMMYIVASLRNYKESIFHHVKTINEKKIAIAYVWQDTQYRDFAEFVDCVIKDIVDAIEIFDEYIPYLEEKIKELN